MASTHVWVFLVTLLNIFIFLLVFLKLYFLGIFYIFFSLTENRLSVYVDDVLVNSTRLDRSTRVVAAPEEGGLFFGGLPGGFNVPTMVGSVNALTGCVQDVIVNNK